MAEIGKNYEEYRVLLGGDSMEAAAGSLFAAATKVKVNPNQRVLLIGIGGAGINTINYIKGLLMERMEETWFKHIGFLAIDSNEEMLNNLKYITDNNEKVCTTRNGVAMRMENEKTMSSAAARSMNPVLANVSWNSNGSGQKRLMGRAKLHDEESNGKAVDRDIVGKISAIWNELVIPSSNHTNVVYIVSSVCGGTGSGAIQDMPALVRKALGTGNRNIKLHAMLYTLDAMENSLPDHAVERAKANCYAALKEINYYQGVEAREDDFLLFPYNDPANRDIRLDRYFDMVLLVGSPQGAVTGADIRAEQTVAEYLLNQFVQSHEISEKGLNEGEQISSVIVNPKKGNQNHFRTLNGNDNMEAVGEAHDFPQSFGAVGFAKASAPYKIVKSYAVSKLCQLMGIYSLANADKNGIEPFREAAFTAPAGTMHAQALLKPFTGLLKTINSGNYSFIEHCHKDEGITYDGIKKGSYDTDKRATDEWIDNQTNPSSMQNLENELSQMYQGYQSLVINFVKDFGPRAFVNVYYGDFLKDGQNTGCGIQRMLQNLKNGYNMDGSDAGYISANTAEEELKETREAIVRRGGGLFKSNFGEANNLRDKWLSRYDAYACARINEKRREMAIGNNKYVDIQILKKADEMTEQLRKFAYLLEGLADIYSGFGEKSRDFKSFSVARDSFCELNLAGMDKATYSWLINQVDGQVKLPNIRQIRDNLVQNFMNNPEEWLDNADALTDNQRALKSPSMPIRARTLFDELLSTYVAAMNLKVSVADIIIRWHAGGVEYSTIAQNILKRLDVESAPLFNGDMANGTVVRMVVYPASLKTAGGESAQFAEALEKASDGDWMLFESDDADGIMMYSIVHEMPVYRQENLKEWENQYLRDVGDYQMGLHGLSPSAVKKTDNQGTVSYIDRISWRDYPAITVQQDARKKDAQGNISYEGQILLNMDQILKLAEAYGIIQYKKTSDNKWICERVWLDGRISWRFDETLINISENKLPTGAELMQEIMEQNDQDISTYTKKIRLLNNAPLMSGEYEGEKWARIYIPRILRANMSMYLEILDTLEKFTTGGWGEAFDKYKKELFRQQQPEIMVRMLLAGMIRKNVKNIWEYAPITGKPKPLFNAGMVKFLKSDERQLANNFLAYYIFTKLQTALSDEIFAAAAEEAEEIVADLIRSQDEDTLTENASIAQKLIQDGVDKLVELGADMEDLEASGKKTFRNQLASYVEEQEQQQFLAFYAKAQAELDKE